MQDLKKLGLSEYEIKIYKTLLIEGSLKGGEISRKSSVPHGRTYEVLQRLVKKGFVQEIKTKPKLFKPIDPAIAVDSLINIKKRELENLKKILPSALKELKKQNHEKRTDEKITVLQGKHVLVPIIHQELKSVKKYFKRMFTFEYLPYDILRAEKVLMKKGIRFQILGTLLNDETLNLMEKAVNAGYEVRYYPVEELRISIVDGEKSMINIVNKNNLQDRTVILVESKELTKTLENYFDILWKKAIPIKNETKIEDIV